MQSRQYIEFLACKKNKLGWMLWGYSQKQGLVIANEDKIDHIRIE